MAKSKVFISWSGKESQEYAELLKTFIGSCIQVTRPFVSTHIEKGARWFEEIETQLSEAVIGIVCLTRSNRESPWILFESGALANGMKKDKLCTVLIELNSTDIEDPLAQFNHTKISEKDEMLKLIKSIHDSLDEGDKIDNDVLTESFETGWTRMEPKLQDMKDKHAKETGKITKPARSNTDLIEEILGLSRSIREQQLEDSSKTFLEISKQQIHKKSFKSKSIRSSLKKHLASMDPDSIHSFADEIRSRIKSDSIVNLPTFMIDQAIRVYIDFNYAAAHEYMADHTNPEIAYQIMDAIERAMLEILL